MYKHQTVLLVYKIATLNWGSAKLKIIPVQMSNLKTLLVNDESTVDNVIVTNKKMFSESS